MDEFLKVLAQAFVNALFIWVAVNLFFYNFFNKIEENINNNKQQDQRETIDAYINIADRTILLFRKDNNEFIAQGYSFEELEVNAKKRYPDRVFKISDDEFKNIKELKQ